jgi:AraC-like DNA-binding protein
MGTVPFVTRLGVPPGMTCRRTFDHHLFSITLEGGATYDFPETQAYVTVGDLLHFRPGAWQDWTADARAGWTVYYLVTDLPPRLLDLLPGSDLGPGVGRVRLAHSPDAIAVREAFARMDAWAETASRVVEPILLNQLEYVLLLVRDRYPAVESDPRVEKARRFLHGCLAQPTTLAEIARAACVSKPTLCRLFGDALATTPLQYLERLRMERAAQMLLFTTVQIDRIARSVGFRDRKYFDRRFRRHWRTTPFRYRKQGSADGQPDTSGRRPAD